MPVPDSKKMTVEIVCKGTIAAAGAGVKPCLNVFHYRRDSNTNPLSKTNVASKFDASILSNIVPVLHADYSCLELLTRFIEDNLDAYQSDVVAEVGGVAGDRAPDYECVTFQLKTNVRGRNYRGSKHFSPIAEADTDGDVIDAAALANWQALKVLLGSSFADADGNNWSPFVWSRSLSTLAGDLWTIVGATVNNVVLNKTLGTVRSRKTATITA